jgi:hypothetical protein
MIYSRTFWAGAVSQSRTTRRIRPKRETEKKGVRGCTATWKPKASSVSATHYFHCTRRFGSSSQLRTHVIGSLTFSSTGFPMRKRLPSPLTA